MDRRAIVQTLRYAVASVVLVGTVAALPSTAFAQVTSEKPQPRLSPNPSETKSIPAGVDTGSPVTSNTVPLGTPVPSSSGDVRPRSAAARLAARPDPLTRNGVSPPPAPIVTEDVKRDASRPLVAASAAGKSASKPSRASSKSAAASAAHADCPALTADAKVSNGDPVALPGSGFVGSSASPQTAAQVARGSARTNCL